MIITLPGADFSSDYIGTLDYWFITPIIGTGAHYSGPHSCPKSEGGQISTITITFDTDYQLAEEGLSIKQTDGQDVIYTTTTNTDGDITIQIQEITGHIIIRISTLNTATGITYMGPDLYTNYEIAIVRRDGEWQTVVGPNSEVYRHTEPIPVDSSNSIWINHVPISNNQNIAACGFYSSSTYNESSFIAPIYWGSFGVTEEEAQALVAQGYHTLPLDRIHPISIADIEKEYGRTIKAVVFQAYQNHRWNNTEAIIYGDPHCQQCAFITKNFAIKRQSDDKYQEVSIDNNTNTTNTPYMTGNYEVTPSSRLWINEVFVKNDTWATAGLYDADGEFQGAVTATDFGLNINSNLEGNEAFQGPQFMPTIEMLETNKGLPKNSIKYVRFVAWSSSASGENTQARVYKW